MIATERKQLRSLFTGVEGHVSEHRGRVKASGHRRVCTFLWFDFFATLWRQLRSDELGVRPSQRTQFVRIIYYQRDRVRFRVLTLSGFNALIVNIQHLDVWT